MSNEQLTLGEGVTEPQDIVLQSIDRETNIDTVIDLTGATLLTMKIRPKDQVTVDVITYDTTADPLRLKFPTVRTTGIVTFTPLGTEFDFAEHFYEFYFMLTDAGGSVIRIPSDGVIPIEILDAF